MLEPIEHRHYKVYTLFLVSLSKSHIKKPIYYVEFYKIGF